MRLKFVRATMAGGTMYRAGNEYEVKDAHAAEVYVAHGYAVALDGGGKKAGTLGAAGVAGQTAAAVAGPVVKSGKK